MNFEQLKVTDLFTARSLIGKYYPRGWRFPVRSYASLDERRDGTTFAMNSSDHLKRFSRGYISRRNLQSWGLSFSLH